MDKDYEYHKKQFSEIKRSTVLFVDWLKSIVGVQNSVVLDMACGAGANTEYLGGEIQKIEFYWYRL